MNPSTSYERRALLEAICADPNLPGNALKLSMTLMAFVNRETGECYPAQRTLKARCHMSRNTIDAMGRKLESRKWLWIERDTGGDRDSNKYHFAFDRVREGGDHYGFSLRDGRDELALIEMPGHDDTKREFHGSKVEPCSAGHGSVSEQSMAQNLTFHGSKVAPELREVNSQNGTQESLLGEGQLPEAPPLDFETWFEQRWWPQYPAGWKIEKHEAKKVAKAIIEGRRSDGLKATPDELMAGVMRYAAAVIGKDPQYNKKPTTWLNKGCWTDEYTARARFGAVNEEAVWAAGEQIAARSKRMAG